MAVEGSRVQKTFINTIASAISQFANVFLSFALRTVFIYTLGVQYTGVSSVFTDILTLLSFSELGIGTAIATALYTPLKNHDELKIRQLMNFYKKAYRLIATIIFVLGVAMLPFLDYLIRDVPDIKESIHLIFFFYIVKTSASYLMIYKSTLLNADQKQYVVKKLETICIILRYVVEIICLLVFKQFMAYLLIEVVAIIVQNYVVTRKAEKAYPYAFVKNSDYLDKQNVKKLKKDIKGLSMYQMSSSIGNSIDNVMVSSFISTSVVGLLSNYTLIRRQLENIVKLFFNAVVPSIGNLVAENDNEKQYIVFKRIFYFSFMLVNFCATSLFVLFNPFMETWLGSDYVMDLKIPFIIAFDFFLYILLQAIASFRTANGMFVKGQYRPLITTILNVILTLFLIKLIGVFGAIFATVLCRLFTQWYDPYLLYKYVFKKKFRYFIGSCFAYILIFLICSLFCFESVEYLELKNNVSKLVASGIVCLVVPNMIALLLTFKTKEFYYFWNLGTSRLLKKRK